MSGWKSMSKSIFFFKCILYFEEFFCSWSCQCVRRGKHYVDSGKMAGSYTKFLKSNVKVWATHTLHTSCDFMMSHAYCRLLKQHINCCYQKGTSVVWLIVFPFQKDSPSKVSVAELAGRFKGHILPMPTSNDEVVPFLLWDNSCWAQILVSSQPDKQHSAIFSE